MSKLAPLTLSLALLFGQAGVALADDSASNNTTGPGSSNSATIEEENSVNVNISNSASVNYNINLNLNTGNNTVSNNTTAGDLVSGDIDASIDLATDINQTNGICDGCLAGLGGGNNTVSNENTGPKSKNDASISRRNRVDVDIDNDADVNYDLDIDANTGGNTCSNNTTVGDCRSGDIRIAVAIDTEINQGGVGGAKPEEPEEEEGLAGGAQPPIAGGVTVGPIAGAGGALFAAGSSLFILLAMLFAAANATYFLSRRNPKFAFHFLTEGKVAKVKKHT